MISWHHRVLFSLAMLIAVLEADSRCNKRTYPGSDTNIVCVCNATYCDEVQPLGSLSDGQVAVYLSTKDGQRLNRSNGKFEQASGNGDTVEIQIDSSKRYQTVFGFGGAFTDSVGINLNKLSSLTREKIIQQYYGENGIQYVIGRVPIASCDFSTHEYSYVDQENDFELKTFNLTSEDFDLKIPYILQAINLTGNKLKLFASPWSPPAWFKTSNKMDGAGTLKGPVNGQYYQSYAKYFVRFFEEYAKNGILFWGLTTQNEPSSGLVPFYSWQTMWLDAYQQQQFIKNHLGPYLRRNKATSKLKIMVNDDNLLSVPLYTDSIFRDAEAAEYIDGIGIHWYLSDIVGRDGLNAHHKKHPDKFILATEACNGYEVFNHGPHLGSWERGDRYGRDIIGVMQRWAVGWTDWNLALDEQGGPNWAKNFVDAPIIINSTTNEFYKQPMFYIMGHFSKFVRPGSQRIDSKIGKLPYNNRLEAIAFVTPTNQRVLIALNSHPYKNYNLEIKEPTQNGVFNYQLPSSSIATFVWNK